MDDHVTLHEKFMSCSLIEPSFFTLFLLGLLSYIAGSLVTVWWTDYTSPSVTSANSVEVEKQAKNRI